MDYSGDLSLSRVSHSLLSASLSLSLSLSPTLALLLLLPSSN
jgi:hypothetical protein